MVTVLDSRCFIGMKQCISWPWNTLFHPDSRCFMTTKHCFILIQGVSWQCFIMIQNVSRCFTTMKQIVSLLIHPDSTCFTVFHDHETNCFIADSSWFNRFHHRFIPLIHLVSCWFNLFHHCFITVSSLFRQRFISGNEPLCILIARPPHLAICNKIKSSRCRHVWAYIVFQSVLIVTNMLDF